MHMHFFNLLQDTLIVVLPDCSHCWSTWHWGQKSNVPWSIVNDHSSFTLSRLFARSPNSSDAKELSRGCKERQLQMCSPQNHFYLLWSILMEGFSFFSALLLGTQSLTKWARQHAVVFGQEDNCRITGNFITFLKKMFSKCKKPH